jgi:hypothetical protein
VNNLTRLALKRKRLQLATALQRQQLAVETAPIDARIRATDDKILRVRNFVKHPLVPAAVAALAISLGPRRVLRMAGKAMFLFSAARRLRGLWG